MKIIGRYSPKICILICLCILCAVLSGCCIEHEWVDATCIEPTTCSKCGATDGKALGHKWEDATCTEPKTCTKCGEVTGEANGHTSSGWTFSYYGDTEAEICSICGETISERPPTGTVTPSTEDTVVGFIERYNWCLAKCMESGKDYSSPPHFISFNDMTSEGSISVDDNIRIEINASSGRNVTSELKTVNFIVPDIHAVDNDLISLHASCYIVATLQGIPSDEQESLLAYMGDARNPAPYITGYQFKNYSVGTLFFFQIRVV